MSVPSPSTATWGALSAFAASTLWGLFPVYFKQVAAVPATEVLCHRIVWSTLAAALLLTLLGRWSSVVWAFGRRRLMATLGLSALVIGVNWGVFIWAVVSGRVVEASLGYFINPLVSVVLGVVVLGERLRRLQWLAVLVAAVGVGYPAIAQGTLPWVAMILAVSFGVYGLIRKVADVEALAGLFLETLVLIPPAFAWLVYLAGSGEGAFGATGPAMDGLLAFSGVATLLPLLLFVAGARRIRLSTLGLLQYLVPTMHFALAVFVYGEPFGSERVVTFVCIWVALAIYTFDLVGHGRKRGTVAG